MPTPRATVICLCYNQARFVAESIASVLAQTWPNVQLIVVDDASEDDSADVIEKCIAGHPEIKFIRMLKNVGNCSAFNHALKFAEGEYVIDLAADDVLMPDRVRKGIEALARAGDMFGVNFTDAEWIGENSSLLYVHSDRFPHASIPQGNIYADLIGRFFICSPTMMFRRNVIDALHGYDEGLAYEDFDFWIRSSRMFQYCYTPEVLVKKRVVRNSMSKKQFSLFSPQLNSTFRVCEKIVALNRNGAEQKALAKRILYEIKVCARLLDFGLVSKYISLYFKNARLRY
jgi:glycosyltransferase involved in cell wall biosynthesis